MGAEFAEKNVDTLAGLGADDVWDELYVEGCHAVLQARERPGEFLEQHIGSGNHDLPDFDKGGAQRLKEFRDEKVHALGRAGTAPEHHLAKHAKRKAHAMHETEELEDPPQKTERLWCLIPRAMTCSSMPRV